MKFITIQNWPRAIAHIDADAFFASVEQAMRPELKGKPVITGAERGIVAAASYEAKALGIKRGTPVHEVKKICPKCIFVPSDYETYSIFSKRMFSIIRRFSPEVEEYSIDEAFADLTGLRRLHRASYGSIGERIKETIEKELGITVSVGISLTKSLSKLCSKFDKPSGLTIVPGRKLHKFLPQIEIEEVWGFGKNISALLRKHSINTAFDFISRPHSFIKKLLGKTGIEIWLELRGQTAYQLNKELKRKYLSITKSKTFTPASNDPKYVYAQAVRNLESACIKARRHHLIADEITVYLKKSDFSFVGGNARLSSGTSSPIELSEPLREIFLEAFDKNRWYRATGVILGRLKPESENQLTLFKNPIRILEKEKINRAIDDINSQFGKHTVFLGSGLNLKKQHIGNRSKRAWRKRNTLPGENKRQRLSIPLINLNTKKRPF